MVHHITGYTSFFSSLTLSKSGDICLNLSTILGSLFITVSISSSVFSSPIVSRNEPWAISSGRPIASNTCDGSILPAVHAEPLDTQIPSMSRLNISDSPSTNSKETLTFPGSLFIGCPFRRVYGILSIPSISLSLSIVCFFMCSSMFLVISSIAVPNPTIPATFSVPALLFLS